MNDRVLHRVFEAAGAPTVNVRVGAGVLRVDAAAEGRVEIEVEPLDDAAHELLDQARIDLHQFGERDEAIVDIPDRRGLFGRSPTF